MQIPDGAWEWGIFYTGLPSQPYRDGLTEEEARGWLDQWVAEGGQAESFVLARRWVGLWYVVGATHSLLAPTRMADTVGSPQASGPHR